MLVLFSFGSVNAQQFDRTLKQANGPDIVVKDRLFGLVNSKGKILQPCEYDSIFVADHGSYIFIKPNTVVVGDDKGKLTKTIFQALYTKTDGYYPFKNNDLIGYLNEKFEIVIEPTYKDAFFFQNSTAIVLKDSLYGVINKQEETIIPFKFQKIKRDPYGFRVYKLNGKFELRTEHGTKSNVHDLNDLWNAHEGRRVAMVIDKYGTKKYGYITDTGHGIIDFKYHDAFDFNDGYAEVVQYHKHGVINKSGEVIVPCTYKTVVKDNTGFKATRAGGQVNYFGWKGEQLNGEQLDKVWGFKEGFAVVKVGDKYGFINEAKRIVFPAKYDDAWDFKGGTGTVELNGIKGAIDKTGNVAWATPKPSKNEEGSSLHAKNTVKYTPRTGKVGMEIHDNKIINKYSNYVYSVEGMALHGNSLYAVGQMFTNTDKPGMIAKFSGINGLSSDIKQTSELIQESVVTFKANTIFNDVYAKNNDVVVGGGESIVVFDGDLKKAKKQLSVPGKIVKKVTSGGMDICVALAIDKEKEILSISGDERTKDCIGLHLIIWNYRTNLKVEKQIINSEIWKYFDLKTLKDNSVILGYSAMALDKDNITYKIDGTPKHTGSVNVLMKINPSHSLSSGIMKTDKSLIMKKTMGYNFEDMIVDRRGNFVISMRNGTNVGLVKVTPDLSDYITYVYGDCEQKTHGRSWEWGTYHGGDNFSRAFVMEDPNSDGYVLSHRFHPNAPSLKNQDGQKLFSAQPYMLYVNGKDLTLDSWDFVNFSTDRRHSGYVNSTAFRNSSSIKSTLYDKTSGLIFMMEQFRDHKKQESEYYGYNLESSVNLWIVKPKLVRNWQSSIKE